MIARKYAKRAAGDKGALVVELNGIAKDVKIFNGKRYLLEEAIKGDVAVRP